MPEIKTVIFDMYQTLVQDPSGQWRISFKSIVEEQGLNITAEQLWEGWRESEEQFRLRRTDPSLPLQSYYDAWASGFRLAFEQMEVAGDADAATSRFFTDLSRREPFPETPQALRELQSRYRTAVLSNADEAYLSPVVARIPASFAAVVSSEGGQCYKPDARLFRMALSQLHADPAECVYVGDKQFEDVKGARSAGMSVVWINRKGEPLNPDLPTPDAEIRDLLELPDVLERLG